MHLLSCVVICTVTDWPFSTQANCSKCPPSAWMHFLVRVNLRSTAGLLMLSATLRIRWSVANLTHVYMRFLTQNLIWN